MSKLTLLHTADVHLDAPAPILGECAAELRALVRRAFARFIDEALRHEVDLVIIAGDLFDRRDPAGDTVEFALAQLGRLAAADPPIHAALLPGTHDCWTDAGLWRSPRLCGLGETVHLLAGPEPVTLHLPHLNLALHGCAHQCGRAGQRPLCALRADPAVAHNVGVAHGSFERGDVADDSMFSATEIAATGMDYLALGHWDTLWCDFTQGTVVAINPGGLEVQGFGEREPGVAALVTLDEGAARVERLPIGRLRATTLSVDVGELTGTEALVVRLAEHADPDLLLRVELTGLAAPGVLIDAEEARARLADSFFAVRIEDASHPALAALDEAQLEGRLTLGRFVELARARIDAATDDRERRIAERALQLGIALLGEGGAR